MSVTFEFFGIPRQRAGRASIEIEAATLGEGLRALGEQLPEFAAACLADGNLQNGYLASHNGRTFTRDPALELHPGDSILILSADPGG